MANTVCNITSSAVVAEAVSGSHVVKIDGYSRMAEMQMENGKYVSSVPFIVGGHSWFIKYYPNGNNTESKDYLSVFLILGSACAKGVKVNFSFALLDKNGGSVQSYSQSCALHTFIGEGSDLGYPKFMKKTDLEESVHLRDDSFSIKCDVTVMNDICSKETTGKQFVVVPPGDLHQHLGNLLNNMNGTDVTFDVGQERFSAHKCILAARSSVFKAEFFGAMSVTDRRNMKIEDIEAGAFRTLLNFIYTDSLPETPQDVEMVQHLLVAADLYNVERLKLICEEKLSKHIDSNMVATTLALAEQHSCHGLKEACFDFLSSHANLERMKASEGYGHLKVSCPSVLKELIARFIPPEMKAAREITMDLQ